MSGHDYTALAPEGVLVAGSVLVLLLGSFLPRRRLPLTRWVASAVLLGSVATALAAGTGSIFEHSYALDPATAVARVVAPLASLGVIWLGAGELARTTREAETYTLVLLGTAGAVVLAGATDLAVLAAGYLLASIPVYALVGLGRAGAAAEAALKTYLLGAMLGVTMLLGTVVLYGVGGATGYRDLHAGLVTAPPAGVAVGLVALLAGLAFKAAAIPGHFWLPDAAQGGSVTAAAFVTTVPKIGGVLAVLRIVDLMGGVAVAATWAVAIMAAASMIVGNLAALGQDDTRRLLGWSAVAQVGFLLMAPAALSDPEALPAVGLYLAGYAVTNVAAFAVAAAHPGRRVMADWAGLARSHPASATALVIAMLGLVGTPPTAIFAGKVTVFSAAWGAGWPWLVVLAAILTVVSLAYYLRWIRAAFIAPPDDQVPDGGAVRSASTVAVAAGVVALGLGLVAGPVLSAFSGHLTS
ncbi:NADH-quinone oxidoreductase subunit N [Isoptericola sp. b490]|uniref:NADH-quinone oxidoreductase subunit N n=1 Tax=Actinotalea lenta TaxID=3064654 RepID=UPI002712C265|nr:NADH-quinone oxidoreductase subunit N [Isoptericola sp. b490]MDO8120718.1 NADH-quinone oxidoreductase subunit N [Isoptericola sp. b490]